MPVISVIVPVYNVEKYISMCIDSILAQTFKDFELLLINDGSSDKSGSICEEYAKKDSRIRVFHKSNGGASSARNLGLEKALGEWVTFVDADDYLGPTMYESIFTAIDDNKNVDYVRLFCKMTSERYSSNIVVNRELKYKVVSRDDYFTKESVGGYTHSLFLKLNIIKENQIYFPENMSLMEDQVFSIDCAINAQYILVLEKPQNYFYYIDNENSITKTVRDNSDDIICCINNVYTTFHKKGSLDIINKYFYDKFLPLKLEKLYKNRIEFKYKSATVKLSPEIKIHFWNLSFKAKIYYLAVRLFKLI